MSAYPIDILVADGPIDWLLGLDRVDWSDPRALLGWRYSLEVWQWLLFGSVALVLSIWSYRHLLGSRYARAGLTIVRTMILLAVLALLAGPMIVILDQNVERDWLVMLVDRSESMTIRDTWSSESMGGMVSRDESLRASLLSHSRVFEDVDFLRDRRLVWLGFDEATYSIQPPWAEQKSWPSADGQFTLLRTALEQTLRRAVGKPIAGIVLLTDGRSAQSTGAGLVRKLNQRGARIFAVPLGGRITPLDLAVGRVDAPQKAFVNDDVPVTVRIERNPPEAQVDLSRLRVKLVDAQTSEVMDEVTASEATFERPLNLIGRAAAIGPVTWRVELEYDALESGALDQPAVVDPVPQNNHAIASIELVDQPIRVLYVEGLPRWEYRYLKDLLIREKSLSSSMMLISADRQFAQEGDEPITRLPNSPEEWAAYDVIVIGDVPADWMTHEQLTMLHDHVAVRGAGLLWIGGPFNTPRGYEGSALTDLLPMRRPGAVKRLATTRTVSMYPWPAADSLHVLRLQDRTDQAGWASLPALQWVQDVGWLKQIAEVLAASEPESAEHAAPLVVRMRYGAGQSIYVATDETWRWRFGRGELHFGQFWTGLIRMLGRHRIQQHTRDVRFDLPYRRLELGQSVTVDLRIEDAILMKRDLARIAVAVYRDRPSRDELERFDLLPRRESNSAESGLFGGAYYRAAWRPGSTGKLILRVVEPALDALNITDRIEVVRPDTELRHTQPDHNRLARLAEQTGGRVLQLDELDQLPDAATSRAEATDIDLSEPLWDSPLALILILLLLTVEWVGRKLIRLV